MILQLYDLVRLEYVSTCTIPMNRKHEKVVSYCEKNLKAYNPLAMWFPDKLKASNLQSHKTFSQ